jgi:hypothetical protein
MEVCERNQMRPELVMFRMERDSLLANNAYDLRLAHPRVELMDVLPVSIIS